MHGLEEKRSTLGRENNLEMLLSNATKKHQTIVDEFYARYPEERPEPKA
jgi:hypothetical protein